MTATSPSWRTGQRGQAVLEFALLTPLVIALIAAVVMFGLGMSQRSSLQQAVREGARQAAVGQSLAQVRALAAGNAPDQLAPADVQVCYPVGPTGTTGQVGDPVKVYIQPGGTGPEGYPFTLVPTISIFNFWKISGVSLRMSPEATSRLEKSVTSPASCP